MRADVEVDIISAMRRESLAGMVDPRPVARSNILEVAHPLTDG